ncbi:MAG: hypothetical protein IH591_00520 [Bacteroidales bacterium]|nr:hypothetical protein [Bacteroidales bacterium]
MELFKSLRINQGARKLRKRALKISRRRGFMNLSEVKQIGIVWDITSSDDLSPISDFILQMGERGIKVDVLGFFGEKVLPDRLTAIRYLKVLKREDFSFWYIPENKDVETFIGNGYDVLIEVCYRDFFPLRYVSTLSDARLKIGPGFNGDELRKHADMLIETGNNRSVRDYLREVLVYLDMIHTR